MMTMRAAVAILIATFTMTVAPASAAPGNDDFVDATVIDDLPYVDVGTSEAATRQDGEPVPSCTTPWGPFPGTGGAGATVWYRFTATTDQTVSFDTLGSEYFTVLALYEGDDLGSLAELACNDDHYGLQSFVTQDLVAGQTVHIQIAGWQPIQDTLTDAGRLRLTVRGSDPTYRPDPATDPAAGDATVVAVIDSGISPYHWDFLASRMPQSLDDNTANDLPLDQAPHTWLPGFPEPETFASYNRVDLTLEENDPNPSFGELRGADADAWEAIRPSTPADVSYHWFPDTKLIGGITFSPDGRIEPPDGIRHGHLVASAAVGNYMGTCPECLLIFLQVQPATTNEERNQQVTAAIGWALEQPWIDVVSSSEGIVIEPPAQPVEGSAFVPDFFDAVADTSLQRSAAERGQTLFQAAGNGLGSGTPHQFVVPNPTITNSMMGPDWVVTVGGVDLDGDHIVGAGKQVDLVAPAIKYPTSFPDGGVGQSRVAPWGTSISTPAVAGTYAQALHLARRVLPGSSRAQHGGMIAMTDGSFDCGQVGADCELADGALTAGELRTRLFEAAIPTGTHRTRSPLYDNYGFANWGQPNDVEEPALIAEEWQLLNQGHGAYFARAQADEAWFAEVDRILHPILGLASPLERPPGERTWMIVDSYCRQEIWGSWEGGYYVAGQTDLPGADAEWPVRSVLEAMCPSLPLPVRTG